ncbi:hypothetical protein Rhe02_57560 [Rhizocola hellebori]|uniref:Rrf2 family transcriptional regulator n=2 Tax=Rhizocola hellebori TaxID=1392758 RepID=A0A8J3VHR6_9ACTN|nr:hypothetical protein Rhe02_57560 [Rhizocola hellebori]
MLAIAALPDSSVTTRELATMQNIPATYLSSILSDLRRAGLLKSRSGTDGGYGLARPAGQISIGDIMRAVSGELASIRSRPPHTISYHGAATHLPALWRAVHAATSELLDNTTLDDLLDSRERATGGP